MLGHVMTLTRVSRLALVPQLAIACLGGTSSMAVGATGARISARLSKTSFTASQAGSVKLIYRFSKPSKRFGYLLTFRSGAGWQTVKRVSRQGSFKGVHTVAVTKLFAGKPVKVGGYRLKLSAQGGSTLLAFKVVKTATGGAPPGAFHKTSPANGATDQASAPTLSWQTSAAAASYEYCIDTTSNNACDGSWVSTNAATSVGLSGLTLGTTYYWQVRATNAQATTTADDDSWFSFAVSGPQAGHWVSTGLSGPVSGGGVEATRVDFSVLSDQATVSQFGFGFRYSGAPRPGGICSGAGYSSINPDATSPITNGQFTSPSSTGPWTGAGLGPFRGTFDSPTSAHGTAQLRVFISGPGCFISTSPSTGTFAWTATRQSS